MPLVGYDGLLVDIELVRGKRYQLIRGKRLKLTVPQCAVASNDQHRWPHFRG